MGGSGQAALCGALEPAPGPERAGVAANGPAPVSAFEPDADGVAALRAAVAEVARCPEARLFVDFDHTLWLSNSSERYLDLARPRWLAALVLDLVDGVAPWRWWGLSRDQGRDPARLWVATLCFPLLYLRWRRWARREGGAWINAKIVHALAGLPPQQVEIVSLGAAPIVAPLLEAAGVPHGGLVASGLLRRPARLRRIGKARALVQRHGEAVVRRSAAVTDSPADADLLDAVAWPVLARWEGDAPWVGQGRSYYPFRYTHRVKYPNKAILRRQLVGEDLCIAGLIYGLPDPRPSTLLALVALWVSFHAAYELGYEENDRVASARERRPVRSRFAGQPHTVRVGWRGWAWALVFAVAGAALLAMGAGPVIFAASLGVWVALLLATRGVFFVFDRLEVQRRIYPFTTLQVAKTLGYGLLLGTTPVGAALGVAQVARQSTNYAIYRYRGDNRSFRRQLHRLVVWAVVMLGLSTAGFVATGAWSVQGGAIAAYLLLRVGLEQRRFARFDVDRRHAPYLRGETDLRPGEA